MGEIVNLNKFRKTRSKADAVKRAAESRSRFGQLKDERARLLKTAEQAKSELDGKRLD